MTSVGRGSTRRVEGVTPLLVVVDMQRGFMVRPTRTVVPAVRGLLSTWRELGRPWVLTRYHNEPGSQFERLLHWYKLRDYPDTEIVSELDEFVPGAAAIVDKSGYTAMTTKVQALIADLQVTDVVVAGLDTDTCVLKTVVDVFEAGLRPWLAADCCASNGGVREHRAGLRLAGRFIGAEQVQPAAAILDALVPAGDR